MPVLNLRIEMSQADRNHLEQLAAHGRDQDEEKRIAQILNERSRTIEQVKRIYAVVMGFAAWSCITNTYQCARRLVDLSPQPWDSYLMLAAQFVAFTSLIALFYLGAERMLDRKYLREDSLVPKWRGLWLDLFTLGTSALFFAVLANSYPYSSLPITSADVKSSLYIYFKDFVILLAVLYVWDIFSLLLQGSLLGRDIASRELRKAYGVWIWINVASFIVIAIAYFGAGKWIATEEWRLAVIAIVLLVGHIIRFFADFILTFQFYFPSDDLTPAAASVV